MNTDLGYIIEECKRGKNGAQANLYKMFASKMFAVCMRYSESREEAEDNLQDGFIRVFEAIKNFKHNGSFEGWLRRVFVSICLKKIKKTVKLYPIDDIEIPDDNWVNSEILEEISQDKLFELINNLPYKYQLVFNMYVLDGYTHEEIGSILKISAGTSKSNLFRAKKLLRDKIVKQLVEI